MPYIQKEAREDYELNINDIVHNLKEAGDGLVDPFTVAAGDANYVITSILDRWLGKHPRYWMYCIAMGTLVCVMLELYRRRTVAYENLKCRQNGDVYTTEHPLG